MQSYILEETRRIVMQCAKQYQKNLLGKQLCTEEHIFIKGKAYRKTRIIA